MKKFISILFMFLLVGCASDVVVDSYAKIDLPANSTTGYEWNYQISDVNIIQFKEEIYEVTENGLTGSGGTKKYTFEALNPGNCTITFTYKRSWEEETLYKITYELEVDEYMNIQQLSKEGNMENIPDFNLKRIQTSADEYK